MSGRLEQKVRFLRLRGSAKPPEPVIQAGPPIRHAAILGADLPSLRPDFLVTEGDSVRAGDPLLTDRKHPDIRVVAPVSGRVDSIQRGPRRSLSALVLQSDDAPPSEAPSGEVRETLLARGMWPAFLTRPFGRLPAPDAWPDAIFVTATRSHPAAPDPQTVLSEQEQAFVGGLEALTTLTEGTVHVCQAPGPDLVQPYGRIEVAHFAEALASAHVHRLCPVRPGRELWTIGYQDVVAIGHLLQTGAYMSERVISITGPDGSRMVRTTLGASLADLTSEVPASARPHILSGPPDAMREAAFLGRYHLQVTLGAEVRERPARRRPIIPLSTLEMALPIRTLPVPLMRALSVGDAETAARLGCLELVEEDMTQLTRLCTSGSDYGHLLRQALDELAAA